MENPSSSTTERTGCFGDPNKASYRFLLLFFNCMLTFGTYYCFDMPSVLQNVFQGNSSCSTNETAENCSCHDCLDMTPTEYNLLYAIYAWTNAFIVIAAGFLIDKCGNRVGVFLFSSACLIGSVIFAIGGMLQGSAALVPVMLLGRLLFGAGNGSLTIVQNRITAFWFSGKELALAFGFTLAFSRLGSVLNFLSTEHLYHALGLSWTLWFGTMLCGLGFICAIMVSVMDVFGVRKLGKENTMSQQSKKVKVTDVKEFSLSYWLICLIIMFFYNGVFPFVADASKFVHDKYEFDEATSAYIAGAVYDVSMIVSPFLGGVIDVFGKRGILALICSLCTIPVFALLAFTNVHALVPIILLGCTYSVAAASTWPSIPLVVKHATIGTAMGLATSIQMIGIGISNVIVGAILGKGNDLPKDEILKRWNYVMIYLLANTLACVTCVILLNINDKRKNGILNLSRKEVERLRENDEENQDKEFNDSKNVNAEEPNIDTESDFEPLVQKK